MFEGRVGYKAAIIKLQYILFYIHNNALIRCLEEFKKNKFVPVEEAEKQIKLGAVITRLNSTIRRIKKYLDGSIPYLEELEETRLPYFEKNADKRENRWSQIISGSDLIDTIYKADSPIFSGCLSLD